MKFQMQHLYFDNTTTFTEDDAPDWLTSKNTVEGSTTDDRWFWNNYVLALKVGHQVKTDFHTITRIK